jgi:deoxyribodipyrimidine photo-lyase
VNRVPPIRIRQANRQPEGPDGDYVLYWMIAFRRTGWNFALQRAVERASAIGKPLVVLEPLRCDYPWASDRLHRFILDGMAVNGRSLESRPAFYYPFVETEKGQGKGLLSAVAERACLVVTDDFPCFFLPRMTRAAAEKLPVRLEMVDSNGLLPLRAADRDYTSASAFRRLLQRELPGHLIEMPAEDPLSEARLPPGEIPLGILHRWPPANGNILAEGARALAMLPIDHGLPPASIRGGTTAARQRLTRFLRGDLGSYPGKRSEPEDEATSGLSPYLHFGHISAHEVFSRIAALQGWTVGDHSPVALGRRNGWWRMGDAAEAFLDQLVTWRELGFNFCAFRDDYDRYDSLPAWARQTLENHAGDPRPYLYGLEEFAGGKTHDPLWNAAQMQLAREGRLHNTLRMLWGKKILEWSASPREALDIMVDLNNRFALDGRDPNSWSGIYWCLGRYDRPWGPERPIFGKIRYMSSENTIRKVRVRDFIRKYAP